MANNLSDQETAEILAAAEALSNMPPVERRAAELLKELLDGQGFTPRDTAGAQGMHDFDLHLDDGRTLAVEVTTDTSSVDRAFEHQIAQPFYPERLSRTWLVYCMVPGSSADDQRASAPRVKELKATLPAILQQLEETKMTELSVPPSPHSDSHPAHPILRELGVQMCYSFDASPETPPRVALRGPSHLSGATGPSLIIDAANQALSDEANKRPKLINARTAGADEAHLFLWLVHAQHHNRASTAMSFLRHDGLARLEPLDRQGIDAVWIAVDAGPSHAPCCRHLWPTLCYDANGWHDWQIRKKSQATSS